MLKARKKKQTINTLEPKVHLKQGQASAKKKRKASKSLTKNVKSKKVRRKDPQKIKKLVILAVLTVFSLLSLYGIYSGIFWTIQLRSSKNQDVKGAGYVIGFDDLPAYPGSDYLFTDFDDNPIISQFLTTGRVVYRLSRNERVSYVFKYYDENLSGTSWDHVLSIPRTSHEMMYGEYYYNEELGYGVRIFDRVNDIWYERLDHNETVTGKSSAVSKQNERNLVLSSSEGTALLPDFPWELKVPKEYIVSYFPTDVGDQRGVIFKEIATGKETILEPVSELDGSPDDKYIESYVDILRGRPINDLQDQSEPDESQPTTNNLWTIVNTRYTEIAGKTLLEGSLTNGPENKTVYILHNYRDMSAYVINVKDGDVNFLNFLLLNITEQKSAYTGEEYRFSN